MIHFINIALYIRMTEDSQLTTEEKFAIIQDLMDEIHSKSGLMAIRSDDVLHGKVLSSTIYTYQIAGSDVNRKTQTSNLQNKIAEVQELASRLEAEPVKIIEEEEEQNDKDRYRYFKSNVRCFRCKKIGHHNYACLDQLPCQYCLSTEHSTDKCSQKTVCYRCYQYGHVNDDCPAMVGAFCQNCKRKHSRRCCFLTKGIDPIKQMFNTDYLYSDSNIRCMRCLQYGHMICSGGSRSVQNENNEY